MDVYDNRVIHTVLVYDDKGNKIKFGKINHCPNKFFKFTIFLILSLS
jgi:hypothetical protein